MRRLWCALTCALALCAVGPALAADVTLFQAFGDFELASFGLTPTLQLQQVRPGRADRVDADGGKVYWQSGNDIFVANTDLSGARLFLHTSTPALDIAVDAAAQRFYVSLPGIGVRALDLADPLVVHGVFAGDYGRVAAGGGKVIAANAAGRVYVSDPDFLTLTTAFDGWQFPIADLAVDASLDALYVLFESDSVILQSRYVAGDGYRVSPHYLISPKEINALAAEGGLFAWAGEDGLNTVDATYFTNPLGDPGSVHLTHHDNFGLWPSDIALLGAAAGPPQVPAPGSAWLVLAALAALCGHARRPEVSAGYLTETPAELPRVK